MATITDKKYGEGHEVQLKSLSPNQKVKDLFKGYVFGKSIFKKTERKYKPEELINLIDLENGDDHVCLIDEKGKKIFVKGNPKAISGIFNHFGGGGKADTKLATEVKENMSMILFRASKMLSEEEAVEELKELSGEKGIKIYTTKDYESAVNQLEVFKKFFGSVNGYEFERQADNFTAPLYKLGTKLSGKSKDNWNPGDVWMKRKSYNLNKLLEIQDIDRLNQEMVTAFNNKDLVGISLKQSKSEAVSEVVDPQKLYNAKVPLDFTFERISSFTEFFRNSYIETKGGFQLRIGHKQQGLVAPFMEGKLAGANYQLGGVDAKEHKKRLKDKYKYTLRNSIKFNFPTDYMSAIKESNQLISKGFLKGEQAKIVTAFNKQVSTINIKSKTEMRELQGRYVNLISFYLEY